MNRVFDHVVIISLESRTDRLTLWRRELGEIDWPFAEVREFRAVDGSRLPLPPDFSQGSGAFGCRQSHVALLQQAMTDGVESLLVLEDDAVLCETFTQRIADFLAAVPSDWEGLMLGGQHHSPPEFVRPGVVRCTNCQRTHAYACRGRYMRDLYLRWLDCNVHTTG